MICTNYRNFSTPQKGALGLAVLGVVVALIVTLGMRGLSDKNRAISGAFIGGGSLGGSLLVFYFSKRGNRREEAREPIGDEPIPALPMLAREKNVPLPLEVSEPEVEEVSPPLVASEPEIEEPHLLTQQEKEDLELFSRELSTTIRNILDDHKRLFQFLKADNTSFTLKYPTHLTLMGPSLHIPYFHSQFEKAKREAGVDPSKMLPFASLSLPEKVKISDFLALAEQLEMYEKWYAQIQIHIDQMLQKPFNVYVNGSRLTCKEDIERLQKERETLLKETEQQYDQSFSLKHNQAFVEYLTNIDTLIFALLDPLYISFIFRSKITNNESQYLSEFYDHINILYQGVLVAEKVDLGVELKLPPLSFDPSKLKGNIQHRLMLDLLIEDGKNVLTYLTKIVSEHRSLLLSTQLKTMESTISKKEQLLERAYEKRYQKEKERKTPAVSELVIEELGDEMEV